MTTYEKVKHAVRFLNSYSDMSNSNYIELAYSGGKDSDVLLWLAGMSNVSFRVVHKCTTIDPPGTLKHVIDAAPNATILRPAMSFFQLIRKKGLPTMFRRFCCAYLKEYYTNKYVMIGVRRSESVKRSIRYKEPERCRVYKKNQKQVQILPLLDFTDADIETIITNERLKVHNIYYNEEGQFNVKCRLGCIGCPLQSDRGKSNFIKYPKFLKLWYRNLVQYYKGDETKAGHVLVFHLFYSNQVHGSVKFLQNFNGLFPHDDFKHILEDYFKISL